MDDIKHIARAFIGITPALLLILVGLLFVAWPWYWTKLVALKLAQAAGWCIGEDLFGR